MSKLFAASLSLLAFGICIVQGLLVGNSFSTTVLRALIALAVFYVIGRVIGLVVHHVTQELTTSRIRQLQAEEHQQAQHSESMNQPEAQPQPQQQPPAQTRTQTAAADVAGGERAAPA